jgi:hypothetical protein
MTTGVTAILATWPILVTVALLALSAWRERRRETVAALQIRLTDALAGELGAVMAPVVSKPPRGPWRVEIRAPIGHPRVVSRTVAIAHDTLTGAGAGPYELILTPGTQPGRPVGALAPRPRRLEAA